MTRIAHIPHASVTGEAKTTLDAVKAKIGMVPNLYATLAHAPAALNGLLALSGALQKGHLTSAEGERIALAIAQYNSCHYCLSAHTLLAKNAGVPAEDVKNARHGKAANPRDAAIVAFAIAVVSQKGQVKDAELAAARAAGLSDGDILEIVANVVANIFTNYVNNVAETAIDFPKVDLTVAA